MNFNSEVRPAKFEDIPAIMRIYSSAKVYMAQTGNPNQWVDGYPSEAIISDDISKGNCYVIESENEIHGVFVFIVGDDPTYSRIDGKWLNSNAYGTIHRIASDGKCRGIFDTAVAFGSQKISNIRIDTHEDNKVMRGKIMESGFEFCGIIYLANGSPRLAFQKNFGKA